MLIKRDDFDEEKYFLEITEKIKKCEENEHKVETKEYEDWLVSFLDKHKSVSDFEDLYLYNKPDDITDNDVKMIDLLYCYWNYKCPEDREKELHQLEFSNMFEVDDDKSIQFEIQGKKYKFSQTAGCGCYIYYIRLI